MSTEEKWADDGQSGATSWEEEFSGDDQIEAFRRIYFDKRHGDHGNRGEHKHGDEEDQIAKRKVLMDMATAYRHMIDIENRLVYNRTYFLLTFNGFFIATSGIILANSEKFHKNSLFLIILAFAVVGVLSALRYKFEIGECRRATLYLREKWRGFLNAFYGCSGPIHLFRDFTLPPIVGLSAREELDKKYSAASHAHWVDVTEDSTIPLRMKAWLYEKTRLENLFIVLWIGLLVLVLCSE